MGYIVFFAAFLFAGTALALLVFGGEKPQCLIGMSAAFSTALLAVLPAVIAQFTGTFGMLEQWAAACVAAVAGAGALVFTVKRGVSFRFSFGDAKALALPLLLFAFTAYLLSTHVLNYSRGAYHSGQSTWGDLPMHLAFVKNIAVSGDFPPSYPLLAGDVKMGYPFLCETPSASLLLLGAPLKTAYILPLLAALAAVYNCAFLLAQTLLGSRARAALANVLFFMGSGFGFAYFMDFAHASPQNFTRIFTRFYQTPTNFTEQNIKWVNPIVDMLVPQRATLMGWALLFACLYMLALAAFEGRNRLFLPLGLLAGALPLVHTHSFLALGVISAALLLYKLICGCTVKEALPWLAYAGIACALALPQLMAFTFPQAAGGGFLRLHFNWANLGDEYFWFYIKNIGLVYILALPAYLNAREELRAFANGGIALLMLCEFIVFQPNDYDNNKLLYIWHFINCVLVADFMRGVYIRLAGVRGRALLAAAVLACCTAGSLLTCARECVSDFEQFGKYEVKAAAYIDANSEKNALFLTADNHNNAVAALAGRKIVCGSSSFLYFHGLDYEKYADKVKRMYEQPNARDFAELGVDYVYISSYERANYEIEYNFFEQNWLVWYNDSDHITIYKNTDAKEAENEYTTS